MPKTEDAEKDKALEAERARKKKEEEAASLALAQRLQQEEEAHAAAARAAEMPGPRRNSIDPTELQQAIDNSKLSAAEDQARKIERELNNQSPPFSSGSSSSSSSDRTPRQGIEDYSHNVNKRSTGTFYGRSNQAKKRIIAGEALDVLDDDKKTPRQKYAALQVAIKENRKYTGNALFHDYDKKGSLESLLKQASNDILKDLENKPYQVNLAKLDAYIAIAEKMEAHNTLNKMKKIGSFVIKSDQVGKLKLATSIRNVIETFLRNSTPNEAELEYIEKQLKSHIEENANLTGDNFLHKPGNLHEILTELQAETTKLKNTPRPVAKP